jgi:spermidine synthase
MHPNSVPAQGQADPALVRSTSIGMTAIVFLSGIAGLIYEVIWTRLFSDIVGSTAIAMTVVFSVFLAAMAIGALLFGRSRRFGPAALRSYGGLEIVIALSGLLTSACLIGGRFWITAHLPRADGGWSSLGLMLGPALLLVGPPALFMGGTLPLILNAVRGWTTPRGLVTNLYGWNTLGGAMGALSTGLYLIWVLGIRGTLLLALALNVAAGVGALLLARRLRQRLGSDVLEEQPLEAGTAAPTSPASRLWMALAFLNGFTVLGYEILWGRMAKFLLGDRTMAISVLLFVFITCLGLGSLLTRRLASRWTDGTAPGALRMAAWLMLAASALHLLLVPVALHTVEGSGLVAWLPIHSHLGARILAIIILIAPPTLALGMVFPLLIWSAQDLNRLPGRVVGLLYFVNMAGATMGAVAASYALCPWVGTLGGFLALTILCVLAAVSLHALHQPARGRKILVIGGALAVLAMGGMAFPRSLVMVRPGETLLDATEDEYGVQVMVSTPEGYLRVRNNRLHLVYDFGHPQTTYAQQMPAHLALLLAAGCERVINIGTGYGITAGTFTLYPDVQEVETVEIIPFLARRQAAFGQGNFDYAKDPRVRIIEGDGRFHLLRSRQPYDVISVNVLDPYLPGSSALFTTDFWREARQRLRPGGIYTQLLWGSDVPRLLKGLRTVFPRILLFPCYGGTSVNVVCFRDEQEGSYLDLHFERLGPRAQAELERLGGGPVPEAMPALLRQSLAVEQMLAPQVAREQGRLHSDDYPILEFRWAHGVSGVPVFDSPLIAQ